MTVESWTRNFMFKIIYPERYEKKYRRGLRHPCNIVRKENLKEKYCIRISCYDFGSYLKIQSDIYLLTPYGYQWAETHDKIINNYKNYR